MTRVLLADKIHPTAVAALQAMPGVEIINQPDASADALPQIVEGMDVLVVRSTKVTGATLRAASSLGLVIRAGAGVNTIDVAEASKRGVFVANCPGKNAAAVAELTLGLMLAIDRRLAQNDAQLKAGKWNKKTFSKARGIKGSTLGIIGTGAIGQEVISRAKPFGLKIIAWSRSLDEALATSLGVERVDSLLELARRSDIVSVHVGLAPETRGFLGAAFFCALKPESMFINTSRAEVVDSAAMLAAIQERGLRVGLDVFDNEPGAGEADFVDAIAGHPSCCGTHHIGASTDQSEQAIGEEVVRIIDTFKRGGEIPNCVNLRRPGKSPGGIVVRHEDRVGVLAGVMGVLKQEGCNVEEMENQIFDAEGAAACARIMLNVVPSDSLLTAIRTQCEGIIQVTRVVG
jgi:D-3-phosphoglycerate dehydrogenase / 2-oxoglutarate reductase